MVKPVAIFMFCFAVVGFAAYIWGDTIFHGKSKCPQIDTFEHGRDYNFHDCMGILVIDSVNPTIGYKYRVRDFKHDYQIIGFDNNKSYAFSNGSMYLAINEQSLEKEIGANKVTKDFFVDGRLQLISYYKDRYPRYLKVDSISGEVHTYVKFEDIPESDRPIFKGLK